MRKINKLNLLIAEIIELTIKSFDCNAKNELFIKSLDWIYTLAKKFDKTSNLEFRFLIMLIFVVVRSSRRYVDS